MIEKVSHTLKTTLHNRLREIAYTQKISESSVIEFALVRLFEHPNDEIGELVRAAGGGLRRQSFCDPNQLRSARRYRDGII